MLDDDHYDWPYKVDADTGCWIWQGARNADGYGLTELGGQWELAHRIVYVDSGKGIPRGYVLDHTCRNRACCNPSHLEPVPQRINWERGNAPTAINARKTHCSRGHEFTPENTILRPGGGRKCRACNNTNVWRNKTNEM